jgi:hypothetical protein
MKHFSFTLLTLIAVGTLHAETRDVAWDQLCAEANGRQIEIKTQTGENVYGFCSQVSDTEVTVRLQDKKFVKIARATLSKVEVHRAKGGQLKSLRRGFRHAMGNSLGVVFSPGAVLGLVAVPVVVAWGATALPFCALADLGAALSGSVELRPI